MLHTSSIVLKNKRATFDYELIDKYTAGIQLYGTEIKSIREGKASLVDSYCVFNNDELWVKNLHISEYKFGSFSNHEVRRERKLLLNRKELNKIFKATRETGLTITTVKLFINEKGMAKLEIAVAKGKKDYDKRNSLKEKEDKRTMDRVMKQ